MFAVVWLICVWKWLWYIVEYGRFVRSRAGYIRWKGPELGNGGGGRDVYFICVDREWRLCAGLFTQERCRVRFRFHLVSLGCGSCGVQLRIDTFCPPSLSGDERREGARRFLHFPKI